MPESSGPAGAIHTLDLILRRREEPSRRMGRGEAAHGSRRATSPRSSHEVVGWVERSETHRISRGFDGFRKCSTHPTRSPHGHCAPVSIQN